MQPHSVVTTCGRKPFEDLPSPDAMATRAAPRAVDDNIHRAVKDTKPQAEGLQPRRRCARQTGAWICCCSFCYRRSQALDSPQPDHNHSQGPW